MLGAVLAGGVVSSLALSLPVDVSLLAASLILAVTVSVAPSAGLAKVVVAKPLLLRWWGLCFDRLWQADCLHCTSDLMYLTNVQRLALGLEGTPDPSQAVVAAAVTKTAYKGYVAPDYKAAAPGSTSGGGTGGGGAKP